MEKKFELFMGCLGNGTTVCNKAVTEHGDYKYIAHISEHGVIKFYVDKSYIPDDAMQKIKAVAQRDKEKFMEKWNRMSYLEKWEYMMEIPTSCGYSPMEKVNYDNKDKSMKERTDLMEKVFFETHM
jgi:hypothetical protein